jgi:hypothetical protein
VPPHERREGVFVVLPDEPPQQLPIRKSGRRLGLGQLADVLKDGCGASARHRWLPPRIVDPPIVIKTEGRQPAEQFPYLFDGDTLKRCAPDKSGEDRPAEFKSPEGSTIGLMVFKKR